ncbi:MAG TPA: hypothetical protein VMS01_03040 [Stellaceae bacterium]|nr:hypothetical protein [Stellaceae bacterium]
MYEPDELRVPDATDDEARAAPIVTKLANAVGALASADGFISPARLETTMSVAGAIGKLLGEPSLTRVLVLRTLSSPPTPRTAIADLGVAAATLPAPERAAVMREFNPLIEGDSRSSIAAKLADTLGVRSPNHLAHSGKGMFDALGSFAQRTMRFGHPETPVFTEARKFGADFDEAWLFEAVTTAQQNGDQSALVHPIKLAVNEVRKRVAAIVRSAEAQAEALSVAQELDDAADRIERVARQRYAAISRRAKMLKRHIREDLNALVEDAAEEFEVDFRRLAEKKSGWFGKLDIDDLNERLVVKNLERRYSNLTRRYQDQLNLLDTEVSEFSEEFTRVGDEALRPMARHDFRTIAPHPSLDLRVKAAVDRASTKTLVGGAAGAAALGAAGHVGLLSGAALAGAVATPVGAVVLGAIALAGVWKLFATPGERRKRDQRERARTLEDGLREEIMAHLPRFDEAVEAILVGFRASAVPEICGPRVEAARIREIATTYRIIASEVIEATNARIEGLLRAFQTV